VICYLKPTADSLEYFTIEHRLRHALQLKVRVTFLTDTQFALLYLSYRLLSFIRKLLTDFAIVMSSRHANRHCASRFAIDKPRFRGHRSFSITSKRGLSGLANPPSPVPSRAQNASLESLVMSHTLTKYSYSANLFISQYPVKTSSLSALMVLVG